MMKSLLIQTFYFRAAQIAQVLIGLAILFTFGLQFFVPMDILWRKIEPRIRKEHHNVSQVLLRAGIVLTMGGVAAAVPKLEPFIGLVGAIFFSILGKQSNVFESSYIFLSHLNFAYN